MQTVLCMITFVKMESGKEVIALLNLIEDPDAEIFEAVSEKIISYGRPIIPQLENLWETTVDDTVQERIEMLIHRLHFNDLKKDFQQWNDTAQHELLPASLLVAKFFYPELSAGKVIQNIERLRRNVWLELNNYLTLLEQANVVNSILYNYYGLSGNLNNYEKPNEFLIPNILESKKGNQTGNGVLYLLLAELLDLPVRLIPIPYQFVLGFFKSTSELDADKLHVNIEFFIDPTSGQLFSHNDLHNYFNRLSMPVLPEYFKPQNNKEVIQRLLSDINQCFTSDAKAYQHQEILSLIDMLH